MKMQKYLLLIALCAAPALGMRDRSCPIRGSFRATVFNCSSMLSKLSQCAPGTKGADESLITCRNASGLELLFHRGDMTKCEEIDDFQRAFLRQ